jgi:hypothetical protein
MDKDWYNGLANFYNAGIQKLVTRYKCPNLQGIMEKKDLRSAVMCKINFF